MKQVHPVEDIGISPWPVDVVEFGADAYAHWKQVDVRQLYSQMPQMAWVSQFDFSSSHSWSQLGTRCRIESQRQTEGLGPRGPTVEQPSQDEKEVLLWSEELWVNILQSVPVSNSPLTHNQHQPFSNPLENKVWEVYFFKEVCPFVHWSLSLLLTMFPCIVVYVLCGYTTAVQLLFQGVLHPGFVQIARSILL